MGTFATDILPRLGYPIIAAPMAGGVSTPELVKAVAVGGGLGFLAAGYKSAGAVRDDIAELRAAGVLFGVNLFVPGPLPADPAAVAGYAQRLAPEVRRYGVSVGAPPEDDTDGWDDKLELVVAERIPVVSFTFGCPSAEVVRRLHDAGSCVLATVTSAAEARVCAQAGVDALCVQGPEAGGHRAAFLPTSASTSTVSLLPLLAQVRDAVPLDLVAGGGIMTGAGIAAVLAAGACAAQLGTAFLRTPESGTNAVHRAALTSPDFPTTSVTRAFTGRPARGLTNRFIREYGDHAPSGYPHIHYLTRPLRKAAAAAGDPEGMALWAGQGYRLIRDLPAAQLVTTLAAEARVAVEEAAGRLGRH